MVVARVERLALAASFTAAGSVLAAKASREGAGALFQRWQVRRRVYGHFPRVFEPRGIVISNDGLALARGKVPATPLRRAVGKMPGQQKRELGRATAGNRSSVGKARPPHCVMPARSAARHPARRRPKTTSVNSTTARAASPAKCVVCAPGRKRAASAKLPCIGSTAVHRWGWSSRGLRARSPVWYSFTRGSSRTTCLVRC